MADLLHTPKRRPGRPRAKRGSSLVRRLVLAREDHAKERVLRWFAAIEDQRLLAFGLIPEEIEALRRAARRK